MSVVACFRTALDKLYDLYSKCGDLSYISDKPMETLVRVRGPTNVQFVRVQRG